MVDPIVLEAEEEFRKYHQRLRRELDEANWHFSVVKCISDNARDYLRELNQAPAFWSLTIKAHRYLCLMHLNNFFGKEAKDKHLHMISFLDFIEKNLNIFSSQAFERRLRTAGRYDEIAAKFNSKIITEKVEQDRQKLEKLPIPSLKAWRNKILSHIDKNDIAQNVNIAKKYPIKTKQIAEIIDTLDDMLNGYSVAFDFVTHAKGLAIEHGIDYILEAIRYRLNAKNSAPQKAT
ncbi:MAG: hypothetical protein MUO99_03820 [Dehalococcoidales bacterium]|nr:hypothetical protein [Dehalococcoidales bacterium]